MIRAVKNKELLAVLSERPSVMEYMKPNDMDDEQLEHYNMVIKKYENLNQLDKDIFYLAIVVGVRRTAELMQCSASLIFKKMKRIKKELGV